MFVVSVKDSLEEIADSITFLCLRDVLSLKRGVEVVTGKLNRSEFSSFWFKGTGWSSLRVKRGFGCWAAFSLGFVDSETYESCFLMMDDNDQFFL